MVAHSDENDTPTLGLVEGRCVRFDEHLEEGGASIRIPHMGWNTISRKQESPILKDVPADAAFYFVHGYYVETAPEKGHRHKPLRYGVLRGVWAGRPVGHPVPPGKERAAGIEDPFQFL